MKKKITERGGAFSDVQRNTTIHVLYARGAVRGENKTCKSEPVHHIRIDWLAECLKQGSLVSYNSFQLLCSQDVDEVKTHPDVEPTCKRRKSNLAEIEVHLTGLTKFKDAVEEFKRIWNEKQTVNFRLEIVALEMLHVKKGIGVFFSTSESNAKQFGWIPKELIGTVENMCKDITNDLKELDITVISFNEVKISRSYTKINATIKIASHNH